MSFDARKLLDVAKQISSSFHNEETYRTSINRAYYSAYLQCNKKIIDEMGIKPNNNNNFSHKTVINFLNDKKYTAPTGVPTPATRIYFQIAGLLRQLKDSRVDADYYLNKTISHQNCVDAINTAQDILDQLNKI
ncbi:hypothetical protein OQJ18_09745 [Fluoribacter dumoffii]|uniref:hypothetical protein n=1 Tax=Legionellaceae TaxID=444 RepID=UPI0022443BA2|nr:hypothetical protein [Fluoribacter dumoffii]MCW8417621.1 hypothetical protein [Fluoribacter dumoffii]MCW8454537.1 hypothetical protein [Fluoribacter dumoffii]MCW8461389.1 hypothetical protein [Fluoribacter dumoffii]MCW8484828.1 hypothetical protein [Fluoribacter dumoffii]